ncbi:glycosyltransferase [Paraglaciecola sp.]|uniref:glycosyltransferase n=1 Tax=Paraglaciecola sp. TaxID=1920173 RepID=UPI00273CF761|nr:glycosyltransferase [Paraglaciecola sp.]MDP5030889.1 glycosyltransferase [Paraglaciecola sp.]
MYLFIGPASNPVTGQSTAFDLLVRSKFKKVSTFLCFPTNKSVVSNLLFIAKVLGKLYRMKPSVVYLSISRTKVGFLRDYMIITMARFHNCKIVVHLHGSDFSRFVEESRTIFKYLIFSVYNKVDRAIVLSDQMKSQFSAFPMIDLIVVPNTVLVPDYILPRDLKGNSLKIGYLSNLIPSKGLAELIAAVKHCVSEGMELECYIAGGSGFDLEFDYKIFSDIKLCEYIHYLGTIKDLEKWHFLVNIDVLILPSYYPTEAQPLCLLEAASVGKHIVFTNINSLDSSFGIFNRSLIKCRDPASISSAIKKLYENRTILVDSKNQNIQIFENHYSFQKHISLIEQSLSF